ncbi:MAG TPA: SIS domain-containing protein, partial [Cellvibrio sp.]|nr:SIS domain-containing protein [Cellvibrio sp.]
MINFIEKELSKLATLIADIQADKALLNQVVESAEIIVETLRNGGKVLIAGNGGSAADAQHIAGEFVSRFHYDRPGLASIALTTDTSILTAIGNDYGYERL